MTFEQALDETREEWNRYRDATTPWPEDKDERVAAIAWRKRINERRLELMLQHPAETRRYHVQQVERDIRADS